MRRQRLIAAALAALPVLAVATAAAADGLETVRAKADGQVYGGPGTDHATVGSIGAGDGVSVTGCLAGYAWCRVIVAGLPGWLPGDRLGFLLNGETVAVSTHGKDLGIPVVEGTPGPLPVGTLKEASPPQGG